MQPAGDDDASVAAEPHHCVNAASKGWDETGDDLLECRALKRRRVPEKLPDAVRVAPRQAGSAHHGGVDGGVARRAELHGRGHHRVVMIADEDVAAAGHSLRLLAADVARPAELAAHREARCDQTVHEHDERRRRPTEARAEVRRIALALFLERGSNGAAHRDHRRLGRRRRGKAAGTQQGNHQQPRRFHGDETMQLTSRHFAPPSSRILGMNSRRALASLSSLLTTALLAVALVAAPQQPAGRETSAQSVASYGLAQMMPVDPEVVVGTLPNGLRYYVRPNGKPANRVELRLVVKAGSVLEDADQLGLAHFVEHMQFEGTQHFPRGGIDAFLASLGLGIGPDANAGTSYDDTQYTLRVPTDSPAVLDRALLVLEDWAHAATFDPDAIERQRGIVLSEWRLHLGAAERTEDKVRGVQLEGSRYVNRPPIGDPDVIQRAQREQLVRFYRDWYRPDLMAVIVVGDVDRDQAVAMIKAHFSPLVTPLSKRPRPAFDVPEKPGTRYTIVTDKESTSTALAISNLRPARPQDTVGGYRQIMMDQLFGDMLDARLDELDQRDNPPFLRVAAGRGLFDTPRTKDEVAAPGAGPERRDHPRTRDDGHRDQPGPPLRVHRKRAHAREADEDARLRARRHREPGPRVVEPRRRVHPQLPAERGAAHGLAGACLPPPVHPRHHPRGDQRAHRAVVPGSEPARDRHRARRRGRRPAHAGAARRRRSRPPRPGRSIATWTSRPA